MLRWRNWEGRGQGREVSWEDKIEFRFNGTDLRFKSNN